MNLNRSYKYAILFLAAFSLLMPTVVAAEEAKFDDLSEGAVGEQLTNGEITFSDLDNGIDSLDSVFAIETEDGTLSDPSFSKPNGLTATAFGSAGAPSEPQPDGLGFGAIQSLTMTAGGKDADSAEMDVHIFARAYHPNHTTVYNTVSLVALKDGGEVGRVDVDIQDITSNHFALSFDGATFDTLRLESSPNPQALMLDNVTINTVGNACKCDLDGSNVCDADDLSMFRQDWIRTECRNSGEGCNCDLDDEIGCDADDLSLFRRDWINTECR